MAIPKRRADTPRPTARPGRAREPSADTTVADRRGPIRRAAALALDRAEAVAGADHAVVVAEAVDRTAGAGAGIGN